ncbi:MAG TPA: hypothetical protein VHQ64_00100 [Pyrinomonadaceae bacterium]|jgi:hypothetical protein|nr:hypothetical protein [Pyrinomonadaceae bacterium]
MADFPGYRITVTEERVDRWIGQFRRADHDLAARVLDSVDFITGEQITAAFRSILKSIPGWNVEEDQRDGRWRFVPFSSSSGESGDAMMHKFRLANGLTSKKHKDLFIWKSDLLRADLGPEDTVVFVDDFSGSGTQACDAWPETEELLPGKPKIYLALVAATVTARDRIQRETEIVVIPHQTIAETENIFSPYCDCFSDAEKNDILRYCRRSDRTNPKGFGDCGLVLVFAHNCPNNSIPILHKSTQNWEGLFRRYD